MTNEEIIIKIQRAEKALNTDLPEDAKARLRATLENLKAQIEKTEEKAEKKEEKLQAEEKKIQSEIEKKIERAEKALNTDMPEDAKSRLRKTLENLKEELAKQKAEIKEDVKESAKETKEIKAAVKKLAEVAKKAGKVKGKKIPKVVVKEEQREKKSEKRQSKLKGMMDELQKLIHNNKFLASKYEGKGVDLKRDAARPAKPFGYRFTGKDNFAVPTKEQIKKGLKDGSVDYEGRANRSDKTPKKEYKLAHGGDVDGNQNAEMVLSKAKELHHHASELENVVKPNSDVEAWEVAKMERASTDASDVTHYEDGKKGKMADGGFLDSFFDKKEEVVFKFKEGEKIKVLQYSGGKLKPIDATIYQHYAAEQPDGTYFPFYWVVGSWENFDEGKKHPSLYAEDELINRHKNKPKMAEGGMMADGGYVTDLDEVVASSDLKEELKSKMKEGDEIVAFGYTDYGGSFGDKVAIEYFKENHPKNIVFEGAAYNGQNGIVFGEVAKDFLEETEDYPLGYEDMESFYYQMQSEQEKKDFKLFLSDIKNKYTIKKDALDWLLENKSGNYSIEPNMVDFSYSELENELEEEGLIKRKKMAKGGKLLGKQKNLDVNKNGKLDAEDFKMLRKGKMAEGGMMADGGMMDEVNTEVIKVKGNIMGTTSLELKIKGMRKPQDFIVYPISNDQAGKPITIQSDTRFGYLDLSSGRGLMSQSHANGAYSYHFSMDKKVPFKISETDVQKIKEHLASKASSKAGNSIIFSDNSGADKMAKGGKLSSKAKYIPKRDIEEVEIDKNGKEVQIDGADLLDGIYVKKATYTKKKGAGRPPAKKATGGQVKAKSNRKGGKSVGQIAALAKQIRKEGEKWTDAIKRASAQLKSKI